jgi:Ca-activated chloride channel family protein
MASLENPWFLLLLAPVGALAAWKVWSAGRRREREAVLAFPAVGDLASSPPGLRARASRWLWTARVAALALMAVAAARPRLGTETVYDTSRGVDIVLCLDVSESMLADDMAERGVTRLDAAKRAADEFVGSRRHDRIALVPFAKHAYRLCPLTLHHEWVKKQLARIRVSISEETRQRLRLKAVPEEERGFTLIDGSRTAIGTALAVATAALKSSEAKSKVIILLTDGQNNFGKLSPLEAADIAKGMGVRVYTVGAGRATEEHSFFGTRRVDPIDEETLREVASRTGGRFFRAEDEDSLRRIYEEIDALEKTEVESVVHTRYDERFTRFAVPALVLVWLEIAAALTVLRRSP